MDEDNTLYELLNVPRTASEAELKKVSIEEHAVTKFTLQGLATDSNILALFRVIASSL
jgi:hypothetical protein